MKLLLILLIFGNNQTSERLARIVDKDGFTNVRAGQGLSFEVVDKVTTDEFFYCDATDSNDWVKVKLFKWRSGNQVTGYVHRSRVQIIEELSEREQKEIIFSVLKKQKLLADEFLASHRKYNKELKKWNSKADSASYRKAVTELEHYSDVAYSPILQVLPKTFCRIKDMVLVNTFFETMWSDRGSANEMPSFAIGECFACNTKGLGDQIKQLKNQKQKALIIDHIEWGLMNKFSVDENKGPSDPEFLRLKKQLDLLRD